MITYHVSKPTTSIYYLTQKCHTKYTHFKTIYLWEEEDSPSTIGNEDIVRDVVILKANAGIRNSV